MSAEARPIRLLGRRALTALESRVRAALEDELEGWLQPQARPEIIAFRVVGADNLRLDTSGDLVITLGAEEIRQLKPVAYQEVAGGRREPNTTSLRNPYATVPTRPDNAFTPTMPLASSNEKPRAFCK